MKALLRRGISAGTVIVLARAVLFADGSGISGSQALLQPASARVAGLAGACASLSGSVDLMNCNPAGLSDIQSFDASLLYRRGFAEDDFANLYLAKSAKFGVFGLSLVHYDTGKIDLYDTGGNLISKVGKRDVAASVAFARKWGSVSSGASVKAVSSEIFGVKASAVAADAGVLCPFGNGWNAGLAVKNLGGSLKFIDEKEKLPWSADIGLSHARVGRKWSFVGSADYARYPDADVGHARFGAEAGFSSRFFLRAGYLLSSADSDADGLRAGWGVKLNGCRIDYAAAFTEDIETPHTVSIGFSF